MSVKTSPPRWQPQASSKEPVTVTFASLAHSTPRRIISIVSISAPCSRSTAEIMALQTELELFSPLDGGICESIVSEYGVERSARILSRVFFTQMRAMALLMFLAPTISMPLPSPPSV